MIEVKTDILINASAEKVYAVLTDFADYPNWNPFIKSVEGKPAVGERLTATMHMEGGKPFYVKPKVLVANSGTEFRWLGHLYFKDLFDGEHYFILESLETNKTRLTHGEQFNGILSGPIMKNIKAGTEKAFQDMNRALKKRIQELESKTAEE